MLLAIDVGNTNIVFTVFDGKSKKLNLRHATDSYRTEDEYYFFLKSLIENASLKTNDIKDIIIASVVPQLNLMLLRLANKYFGVVPLFIGDKNLKINLRIKIDHPEALGADLIAGSVGAINKFGNNLLIIDFGTATTFGIIGDDRDFIGAAIAPGINSSIKALHRSTSLLPLFEFKEPSKVIPTSGEDALSAGIYYGYIGLVKEIVNRFQQAYPKKLTIIATGGDGENFQSIMPIIDHYDSDLVTDGLRKIYEDNI